MNDFAFEQKPQHLFVHSIIKTSKQIVSFDSKKSHFHSINVLFINNRNFYYFPNLFYK